MSLIQLLASDEQADWQPCCREAHGDDPYVPYRNPERFADSLLLSGVERFDKKDIGLRIR